MLAGAIDFARGGVRRASFATTLFATMDDSARQSATVSDSSRARWLIAVILLVATAVRSVDLASAPPGMFPDEGANAWNAWCLLNTGTDDAGQAWPLLHFRAFGEHRSALFLYFVIPFQAIGGFNIWTARLPGVFAGVLAIPVLYYIVRRLFDRPTALVAAAMMAVNPWAVALSRWGHESAATPLLVLVPLAAMMWAGFPPGGGSRPVRAWRALIAGLSIGVCCWGYPAVRLFVPPFLLLMVIGSIGGWRAILVDRANRAGLIALVLGTAATFGPLVYEHVVHPDVIGKRMRQTAIWKDEDALGRRVDLVWKRYAAHFQPEFLFVSGDQYELHWSSGTPLLPGYLIPLMAIGGAIALWRARSSAAARVLLIGVVCYPLGDMLSSHPSAHALRSSPGLPAMMMIAAVGFMAAARMVASWRLRTASLTIAAAFAFVVVETSAPFFTDYFGDRNRRLPVYRGYLADFMEACRRIQPHLESVDAVATTTDDLNQPFVVALQTLQYDPHRWFREPREYRQNVIWLDVLRFGKWYFFHDRQAPWSFVRLRAENPAARIAYILRPHEVERFPELAGREATMTIVSPDNHASLVVFLPR